MDFQPVLFQSSVRSRLRLAVKQRDWAATKVTGFIEQKATERTELRDFLCYLRFLLFKMHPIAASCYGSICRCQAA
jgi:hypothetical protein